MSSRGRPRNFLREEALRSAMEIFWDKGFDNTSLADLTRVMRLNPPSLYAAFGSKAKLFLEAVDLYGRTDGAGIWEFLDSAPTAKAAVHDLLRRSAENFTQWAEPRGCMVVLSAPQMEGGRCGGVQWPEGPTAGKAGGLAATPRAWGGRR
ncbi:TetR/AcrR family transcriptional regulator [Ensifer canadensis]